MSNDARANTITGNTMQQTSVTISSSSNRFAILQVNETDKVQGDAGPANFTQQ